MSHTWIKVERAVADFWKNSYKPAQGHKAHGSLVAEEALWNKWLKPHITPASEANLHISKLLREKI